MNGPGVLRLLSPGMPGPTRHRLGAALGAVALVAALGVAGCSGDSDDASPPTSPAPGAGSSTTTAPATTTTTGPPATLPATFPTTAVPLPGRARLTEAMEIPAARSLVVGWVLTYRSEQGAADAVAAYGSRLAAAGFKITDTAIVEGNRRSKPKSTSIFATTPAWTVTTIANDFGSRKATLVVSVSPHQTLFGPRASMPPPTTASP